MDPRAANKLFEEISGKIYERWQILIARDDHFLSAVYWKGREGQCPDDHFERNYFDEEFVDEENLDSFRFTSQHGYLVVFLQHLLLHGPEETMACNTTNLLAFN